MAFPFAAVIPAVASLIGGKMANDANANSAKDQMNFQQNMSDSVHQRNRRDLELAGYNPMLGALGGSPMSPPAGASYSAQDVVTPAINSAKTSAETKKVNTELANIQSQTKLNLSNADKAAAETRSTLADLPKKETMNIPYQAADKLLNPVKQLINGDNSAKSLDAKTLISPSGVLPPYIGGNSAKSIQENDPYHGAKARGAATRAKIQKWYTDTMNKPNPYQRKK